MEPSQKKQRCLRRQLSFDARHYSISRRANRADAKTPPWTQLLPDFWSSQLHRPCLCFSLQGHMPLFDLLLGDYGTWPATSSGRSSRVPLHARFDPKLLRFWQQQHPNRSAPATYTGSKANTGKEKQERPQRPRCFADANTCTKEGGMFSRGGVSGGGISMGVWLWSLLGWCLPGWHPSRGANQRSRCSRNHCSTRICWSAWTHSSRCGCGSSGCPRDSGAATWSRKRRQRCAGWRAPAHLARSWSTRLVLWRHETAPAEEKNKIRLNEMSQSRPDGSFIFSNVQWSWNSKQRFTQGKYKVGNLDTKWR